MREREEPLKRMETCRSDEDEVGIGNNDVISEQGFGISASKCNRKGLIVLDVLYNENGEDLPAHFLTAVEWMINRRSTLKAKQVLGGSSSWFSGGEYFGSQH